MGAKMVSLRVDEELLGWATGYAAERGVSRTSVPVLPPAVHAASHAAAVLRATPRYYSSSWRLLCVGLEAVLARTSEREHLEPPVELVGHGVQD
jgi:hypothetical protein